MRRSKYRITEIFYSIQGEGKTIGQPAVFVRFAGCNNLCSFCDSTYSSYGVKKSHELSAKQIFDRVSKFKCPNVVLTGGEPCLQIDENLLSYFDVKNITIETNGLELPKEFDSIKFLRPFIFWSISPKLSNAGPKAKHNVETIKEIVKAYPDSFQLKFVVGNASDVAEAIGLANKVLPARGNPPREPLRKFPLIFQPEWHEVKGKKSRLEDYLKKCRELVELIKKSRFDDVHYEVRVIPQIHKIFWGFKKGV